MLVYRISQTRYADDLSGEGARLFGGRWNLPLTACLYTSESRALALLEYSVNISLFDIRRALSIITIKVNEKSVREVRVHELPGNWNENMIPQHTQEFGTRLLLEKKYPVIKIPSVVIPGEYNYLINPLSNPDVKIMEKVDYAYDLRIKIK